MSEHRQVGRVLVSGGASGLGAAVVAAVADAGGTPVVLDRSTTSGHLAFEVDVTDGPAVETAVNEAASQLGGLDAVVTAAGIDKPGSFDTVPAETWDSVVSVNLTGTANVARAAMPHVLASRGRIVTVASSLGLRALPDATAYCASKFGVIGFSRALAAETRGRLGVTTLIPGGMKTAFFDGRDEQYRPPDDASLNDPTAVADAVLFALTQPAGSQVRELLVCHDEEPSWP
ncbi:SDR family oxidoreductase [Demequina sp. SO4-13]|uniref:SDR family oxidoreductase n=1 Tax=Demequina sp. SO4-13 TaxID=3401027 RepID=UPI003AF61599